MIRVAFVIEKSHENWMGGINYFQNLIKTIYRFPDRKIEAVLFVGKKVKLGLFSNFPPVEVIQTACLDPETPEGLFRNVWKFLFADDAFLEKRLIKERISLLSHSSYLGKRAKLPTIGWIPDFQHRHLPHFFTPREFKSREREYKRVCDLCSCLLLSSYSVQKDLEEFNPSCLGKSKVLQFAVDPAMGLDEPGVEKLQKIYGFRGPYMFVPNQFWAHKNHRVVIEALKLLKEQGRKVLVLATGNPHDYRQPDYFNSLMEYARECDVMDRFQVLGRVPYTDLIALIRHAVSLINPSLFEGWSTTVEEARSLGQHIILSDIPVHREQSPRGSSFFDPSSSKSLADLMWRRWSQRDAKEDETRTTRAREELPERMEQFARNYEHIVMETLEKAGAR